MLAAGDKPAAERALDFLFDHQQLKDGSFPQNSQVDGRPKWKSLQMDQVGLPIVLAWQLGRTKPADWRHVRSAADLIVEKGPVSEQERWENQEGYSPGTIAAEIAGLI
jgi:glucoamylase